MKLLSLFFGFFFVGASASIHTPPTDTCIQKSLKQINGESMEPMIQNGAKIFLLENFYTCTDSKPKKGDLVAYEYGGNKNPIIKKIIATSTDTVEIREKKLFVNGGEIKNSNKESYTFSDGEINIMSIYISPSEKKIPKDSYFILGDNIHNSIDSRKFGAISEKNFLGKFEIISQ